MEQSIDLPSLLDREKIRDCIARISRGEDRRDAALLDSCYWPDARDDHGIWVGSSQEFRDWVVPGFPAMLLTLHTLGQSIIVLHGVTAVAETHVSAYHRVDMGSEHRDIFVGGRYLDRLERRGDEWRIAHRTMVYDWLQDIGQSVDWSKGLLGMPFLNNHSVGSTRGDYSETLFQ